MSSFINTNINSLIAQQNLAMNQSSLTTSITRLSSGLRINSAADDPAGLAIADRMSSQVNGVNQAVLNTNNGISMAQTADGAMASIVSSLQQVRTLAVEAANATNSASDRQSLNDQANALLQGIQQTALTAQFNGQNLLDGSFGTATFQVGANANQTVSLSTGNFQTSQYGVQQVHSADVPAFAGTLGSSTTPALAMPYVPPAGPTSGLAGTLQIDGESTATVTLLATDTAATAAAAVNALQAATGVTATARNVSQLDFTGANTGPYTLQVQGDNTVPVNVSFNVSGITASGLASAMQAFNQVSGQTGITATMNSGNSGLILTDAAGNNIGMSATTVPTGAGLAPTLSSENPTLTASNGGVPGFDATTANNLSQGSTVVTTGTLQYNSSQSFTIDAASLSVLNGTTPGTASGSSLTAVNTINLSTAQGATNALAVIDGAINSVDAQRAKFGAVEAQFSQVVSTLESTSTNLQSSRSQIQDANFAAETANLSRTQILQQAGTAMVAQANQLPQGVLALLK